jgi:hypothetical protein
MYVDGFVNSLLEFDTSGESASACANDGYMKVKQSRVQVILCRS